MARKKHQDEDVLFPRDLDVLRQYSLALHLGLTRETNFPVDRVDAEIEVGVFAKQSANAVIHLQFFKPREEPRNAC